MISHYNMSILEFNTMFACKCNLTLKNSSGSGDQTNFWEMISGNAVFVQSPWSNERHSFSFWPLWPSYVTFLLFILSLIFWSLSGKRLIMYIFLCPGHSAKMMRSNAVWKALKCGISSGVPNVHWYFHSVKSKHFISKKQYRCHRIKLTMHSVMPIRCRDAGLAWSHVPWTSGAVGTRHHEWLLTGFPGPVLSIFVLSTVHMPS